ncbi:hypothetical protein EDD11_007496, partial [Mortierella claussenii]
GTALHQPRHSAGSDMTDPFSYSGGNSQFSNLLATGSIGLHDPQHQALTPHSNAPPSPAATMPAPGDVIGQGAGGASIATAEMEMTLPQRNPETNPTDSVFYYAKFPFRASEMGELGFKSGERILVVDMSDDIWWMGILQDADGRQVHGVFPSNYVGLTPS